MHTQDFHRTALSVAILLAFSGAALAQTAATPSTATLSTINVTSSADASAAGLPADYAGGQVARGGRLGLLGNTDRMDSPVSSTAYTRSLMQDQQTRSVGDVLLNDPTVRVTRGFGNYQEMYIIRGFPLYSDDMAYNGLYGLLPRQYVATELLERVEVMRGASALLNGAAPGGSGLGGSVNLLPKRAPNEPLTQITAGVESGGNVYLATDLARRFGPDNASGIRFNAVRRDGDTAIDNEKRELSVLSIGLDTRGRDYRLSADLGYQNQKLDSARPSVSLSSGIAVPRAPDASSNFSQPWAYSNERDVFGTVRGEFDLSPDATVWVAAGARDGKENNSLANPTVLNNAGDIGTYRFDNARHDETYTGEAGLRFKARTGSVGHSVSLVASTFKQDSKNAYGTSDYLGLTTNLYNAANFAQPAITSVGGGNLSDPNITTQYKLNSIGLGDTLSLLNDTLLITVGARYQSIEQNAYSYAGGVQYDSYDKSRVTPMAGVVYKASKNVSLYANYIEGLAKGPTASGTNITNIGEVFAPYRTKQEEIGVKYDAGTYGADIAVFTTAKPLAFVSNNTFGVNGEQRNRGIELTMFGQPLKSLKVLGGMTFLQAKQRDTGGTTNGNYVIGAPKFQANVGTEWAIPGVAGLTLSGRALYTGEQFVDAANTQRLPSWTRLDAGLRYVTNVGKNVVTVRGQIENLANRNYWASAGSDYGYLVLGNPRTFVLSASMDF
ncbi:MAG: TonB-dependent receptor [Janthinobacterium lividum]